MAKTRSFGASCYVNGIAVGGLTDISAPGVEVTFIDTTSHDEGSGFKTFLSGLKDGGSLELTGKYNYADVGQAEWKAEEGVSHTFYIILPDNSGFAFTAIVGGFQTSNPLDDAVEFTATARITGEVFPVFPTMTVTGTLTSDGSTPITFPSLSFAGIVNGFPVYSDTGETSGYDYGIYNSAPIWSIAALASSWDSSEDSMTPDEVTTWVVNAPATGTPVVTGS